MSSRTGIAVLALALFPGQARPPGPSPALERVVVIGASLSAGFGLDRSLAQALAASLVAEPEPPRSHTSALLFMNPLGIGPGLVESALDDEPTLVVALDFPFWFGYGATNAAGGPIASEDERLALLERGLDFLDELECPLVVGDFPDMSKAVGKMLVEEQVPRPETLVRLTRRLREWAEERGQVVVLPFAELVRSLESSQALRIGRHEWPAGTRLLQPDELHPTLTGLAAVAQLVADELVRAELIREDEASFVLAQVLAELAGAEALGVSGAGR